MMRIRLDEDGGPVNVTITGTKDVHIEFDHSYQLRLSVSDAKKLAEGILESCEIPIIRLKQISNELRELLDEALMLSTDERAEETWYNIMCSQICDWDDISGCGDVTIQDTIDKMKP